MQNLDVIYIWFTSGSHPCRNGWTLQHFHIWSHIHAEYGGDGCHICKIHVKSSARAVRSLAMQIIKSLPESHLRKFAGENHIQGHIHAESWGKSSHLKSHPNHIRNHIHAESIHFQGTTLNRRCCYWGHVMPILGTPKVKIQVIDLRYQIAIWRAQMQWGPSPMHARAPNSYLVS